MTDKKARPMGIPEAIATVGVAWANTICAVGTAFANVLLRLTSKP